MHSRMSTLFMVTVVIEEVLQVHRLGQDVLNDGVIVRFPVSGEHLVDVVDVSGQQCRAFAQSPQVTDQLQPGFMMMKYRPQVQGPELSQLLCRLVLNLFEIDTTVHQVLTVDSGGM